MMKGQWCLRCAALFTALLTALVLAPGVWAEECPGWVRVASVEGEVEAKRQGSAAWEAAPLEKTYCPGDMIRVGAQSRAALVLSSDTIIRLDQHTTVTLMAPEKGGWSLIDLLTGAVHFISRVPRTLKVITPYVNAAVEGTEFLVRVADRETVVTVYEGQVVADNRAGELTLTSGQSAVAKAGAAPISRIMVRPRDAVHWALYYPPILNLRADQYAGADPSAWKGAVRDSMERVRGGDLTGAFSSLKSVPEEISDPQFYHYRAALLLSVGRVDGASRDIARSLRLAPANSTASALQAIISLAQNDKEKARTLAQNAVLADPDSATARVALSYVRQAAFDLPGALAALQIGIQLEPENGLAWARLSELQLSLERLDLALNGAERAVELNPRLARTQSVLGFAYLSQVNTASAKEALQEAIALDPGDPLSRMGLGLALIREGSLREGRRELEIATSLDPNDSLIRSYMGKAYYEEKRNALAMSQYELARELDPQDPTSFFYEAIGKQSVNRPVEALHEMEQAIEKNDNRAVYRSKLLLDEDLAARSASLARIYSDLGFEQLALAEGWKSVNTDPDNYSAHRFLADSYSALPRHEMARVNELLQSQLIQPINITPVQPRLAESRLFILNGAGPGSLSFNEFNPLFNRDRVTAQVSGVVGGNDTLGDEVVVSGIEGKFSFSAGQFHYETDGFRVNNDQKHDLYNIFAQYSLAPDTSIQAEYRSKETENGDLELTFTEDFSPDLREEDEVNTLRLGFHHAFSPSSHLLASFIYQDGDLVTDVFPGLFSLASDVEHSVGEIGYQVRSGRLHTTAGVGHRRIDDTTVATFAGFPSEEDDVSRYTNLYLYSEIELGNRLNLTLGASADFLNGRVDDRNQVNPKLGLTWTPAPGTTLRAAAFRTLQRPVVSRKDIDPSLEPTEVAGFNQFFFTGEADEAWRYGLAIDQKISAKLYGGAEFSARDLDVAILDTSTGAPVLLRRDWDEQLGRAYLYWTPFDFLSVKSEYLYERFKRESSGGFTGTEQFTRLRTHRVPLGVRFFHPCGLSAGLQATYVNQDGDFTVPVPMSPLFSVVSGEDTFWVVDASLGYRLPKRYGMVSLEGKNLFDKGFHFQDTDPGNPQILPDRLVLFKVTLAF